MSVKRGAWLGHQRLVGLLIAPAIALGAPSAYITNGGSGTVSVIDTTTNVVVAMVRAEFGAFGVAVNSAGNFSHESSTEALSPGDLQGINWGALAQSSPLEGREQLLTTLWGEPCNP